MQQYIHNDDENLPPIDRFNLGQKYFFWVMLFAGLVLLATGLAMWFTGSLPLALRPVMILLHVSAALVTIGAFIIHWLGGIGCQAGVPSSHLSHPPTQHTRQPSM